MAIWSWSDDGWIRLYWKQISNFCTVVKAYCSQWDLLCLRDCLLYRLLYHKSLIFKNNLLVAEQENSCQDMRERYCWVNCYLMLALFERVPVDILGLVYLNPRSKPMVVYVKRLVTCRLCSKFQIYKIIRCIHKFSESLKNWD